MPASNGNSFTGSGSFLAPADDPLVLSLPAVLRMAIAGFDGSGQRWG